MRLSWTATAGTGGAVVVGTCLVLYNRWPAVRLGWSATVGTEEAVVVRRFPGLGAFSFPAGGFWPAAWLGLSAARGAVYSGKEIVGCCKGKNAFMRTNFFAPEGRKSRYWVGVVARR